MNIGQAIEKYTSDRANAVSPALRELINQMIESKAQTEFQNDSYLDALYLTDVMFSRARCSVRLLTGPGADGFLCALRPSFTAVLERFSSTGGTVEIVLLSEVMPAVMEELMRAYPSVLAIRRAGSSQPIKHFIVCDSQMARLEEVHDPITHESPASEIKARVYFNEPEKAKVFEKYFDSIWEAIATYPINMETAAPQ